MVKSKAEQITVCIECHVVFSMQVEFDFTHFKDCKLFFGCELSLPTHVLI